MVYGCNVAIREGAGGVEEEWVEEPGKEDKELAIDVLSSEAM